VRFVSAALAGRPFVLCASYLGAWGGDNTPKAQLS